MSPYYEVLHLLLYNILLNIIKLWIVNNNTNYLLLLAVVVVVNTMLLIFIYNDIYFIYVYEY